MGDHLFDRPSMILNHCGSCQDSYHSRNKSPALQLPCDLRTQRQRIVLEGLLCIKVVLLVLDDASICTTLRDELVCQVVDSSDTIFVYCHTL